MAADDTSERCTWCGASVEGDDGYRLAEEPGARHAVFCRLEHVVPWAIQGGEFPPGGSRPPDPRGTVAGSVVDCAECGEPLGEVRLVLVRHRGEHRIPDGLCSVDHLRAWAAAGGRWR